jgi:hypothetical protein
MAVIEAVEERGKTNDRRGFSGEKAMRKQLVKWMSLVSVALAALLFAAQRAAADGDDPPSRVARLAYTGGNVSFNPAGTDDWVAAVVNRPMTTGDKLWSDDGSRAELHLDTAIIRLSDHTGFSFLNLSDEITQLRLTEGTLYLRVRRLGDDETFEVDTPNLAFSILRPGRYRINVNEAGDATIVTVRDGQGEVTGGGSAYAVHAREEGVFNGTDQLDADVERIRQDEDDFDQWCDERDRRDDHSVSSRYVSDDVVGYEDLDQYGGWRAVPEYGNVWFPHTVVVGWAPYRYGHWVWIAPWGWTWVDDAPWGFAPFHYGRWVVVGGVWGWVPCPPRPAVVTVAYVRPVYAPALVAWVGGAHWGVGVAVGGAPAAGVAWFPLGPRDVYCPSYHVSQTYVTNVNVSNTTIINRTQITNVYNNVYVNKTVNVTDVTYQNQTAPNAVTAVSHQAFVSAQPVHNNMIRAGQREFGSAPVAPIAPAVAPEQRSVLGAGAEARVRPPAPILSRPVVAKMAPPPPPVSFVKQQEIVRQNGGRPPAVSEMRRAETENVPAARPNIKMAPPVRQAPAQNAPMARSDNANRPAPPNVTSQPNQGNRPGNAPANAGNPRPYNDRPPSSRPGNSGGNDYNPQLEQKHQQELQDLRNKQDQERQKVEQQQVQQRQKLDQGNGRSQQQQTPSNGQAGPRQQQAAPPADQRQQQFEQKQQQLEQKQQHQLQQLEQKHDQQQQRLEQRQEQEHQKPAKQDKPATQDKPSKSDKPHR